MSLRSRITRITLAAAAAGLVAVAAACGGGTASNPTPRSQVQTKAGAATQSATTGASAHTDHVAEIDQQNLAFMPSRVAIKVGETVLIKNSESAIHTANINGKNITGNMKKGASTAWTASAAGEYKVSCDYHPQMSATITVS